MKPNKSSYKDVRIGVYAICGDEPTGFIDRWLESMQGADKIWVLVTQETDTNLKALRAWKEKLGDKLEIYSMEIQPWRFDKARNLSLELAGCEHGFDSVDALVCTDIDEVLIEDFWDDYRKVVFEHPNFDRVLYRYAWSHDENGDPDRVFWYDKTHQPTSYHWEYPVHETLVKNADATCEGVYRLDEGKIYLHHYPDISKSRGSYLNLLELRAQECPNDLYGLFYLGREYSFVHRLDKTVSVMVGLYLRLMSQNLPDDYCMKPAICYSVADAYRIMGLSDLAEVWYKRGISDDARYRDNYIGLAQFYAWNNRPDDALDVLKEMEEHSVYIEDWRTSPHMWSVWKREQIIADCLMWKGEYRFAAVHMERALQDIRTETDRVQATQEGFYSDLKFLQEKLQNI